MQDKTSFSNSNQPQQISEELREYINSMVEEIVINGTPFDETKKKWLKKFCDEENVNYANFESGFVDFLELLCDYKKSQSPALKKVLQHKGRVCFIEEDVLEKCLVVKPINIQKTINPALVVVGKVLLITVVGVWSCMCFYLSFSYGMNSFLSLIICLSYLFIGISSLKIARLYKKFKIFGIGCIICSIIHLLPFFILFAGISVDLFVLYSVDTAAILFLMYGIFRIFSNKQLI
jgi:hypothetical protein